MSYTERTDEELQDLVGAMLSSNTETGITVSYQDGDGTIDLVVNTTHFHSSVQTVTSQMLHQQYHLHSVNYQTHNTMLFS